MSDQERGGFALISPEIAVRSSVISGAGLQTTELWRVLISRRTHAKAECGARQFIRQVSKLILAVPDDPRDAPAGVYWSALIASLERAQA